MTTTPPVFYCVTEECVNYLRSIPAKPPSQWATGIWQVRPTCPMCFRYAFWSFNLPGQRDTSTLRTL